MSAQLAPKELRKIEWKHEPLEHGMAVGYDCAACYDSEGDHEPWPCDAILLLRMVRELQNVLGGKKPKGL